MRRFVCKPAAVLALALAAGCLDGGAGYGPVRCPAVDPQASVFVDGRYRYASYRFTLRGTITFAQVAGDPRVRVTGTTYDNAGDRPLVGESVLQGNRLDIRLVPRASTTGGNDGGENGGIDGGNDAGQDAHNDGGRPDYSAQVSFVFYEAGARFCLLGFSDSNGDVGDMGSYVGQALLIGARQYERR
jgi:hypothetical protein